MIMTNICFNKVEIERFAFIRNQRDLGLASLAFLVSWMEYFVPWQLSQLLNSIYYCSDESQPPWFLFAGWMILQVLICLIPLLNAKCKIPKFLSKLGKFVLKLPMIHMMLLTSVFNISFQYWQLLVSTTCNIFYIDAISNNNNLCSWNKQTSSLNLIMKEKTISIYATLQILQPTLTFFLLISSTLKKFVTGNGLGF